MTEPGYEAQVDFVQYVMKTEYKKYVRVYFFCMTLSFSRMKFAYFSVEPFNIKKTIDAHIATFKYFGGRPQIIVYDQDKTMVVSENLGEVIFVREFEDSIKETGFTIYLCKGYAPSTKSKIEKTVDYIKHQFLDGRIYYGIDRLTQEFIGWLDRDSNGMIHQITKKPPRELFKKEYPKLQKYVEKKNDDQLIFYHAGTNELLCKPRLLLGEGNVVTLNVEVYDEPTIEEVLLDEYKDYEISSIFFKRLLTAGTIS